MILGDQFFSEEQKRQIEGLGLIVGQKPLIELLYTLIRQRPTEGYAKDASLNLLLDQIAASGVLPVINDTQEVTLASGKAAFMQSIDNTKNEFKKQVKQKIIEANKEVKAEKVTRRYTVAPIPKKKDYTGLLLTALAATAIAVNKEFHKTFTTELTNFINESTIDQLVERAILTGAPVVDSEVYKVVVNDNSLCEWCKKFYTENGQPKLYKLSELQANGSNYGKPKSEWKPVIGATHVRCRCQLHIK